MKGKKGTRNWGERGTFVSKCPPSGYDRELKKIT
jgi:hypothetical protein